MSVRSVTGPCPRPRSLAGNPDSPQAIVFITSIIDIMVGFETYYIYYYAT